jgi:hypothetical protein
VGITQSIASWQQRPAVDIERPSQAVVVVAEEMSEEERLDRIHAVITERFGCVRKSCMMYDMMTSYETLPNDRVREVMWMNASHLYVPIIQYNADQGRFGRGFVVHRSVLAGMIMHGVGRECVSAVIDLVWNGFLLNSQRYPLFREESLLLVAVVVDPAIVEPAPPEPEPEMEDVEIVIDLQAAQPALAIAPARKRNNGQHQEVVVVVAPPPPAAASKTKSKKTE